jgi:phosphoribosyl 1,2-cyclic phosphate phosphodiesterase
MKVTLLGTGTSQGVPVLGCACEVCRSKNPRDNRLRTSCLVETEEANVLIDCGPDLRQQLLRYPVERIDAVLLTHDHQDHVAGLDELRAFIFKQNKPMPIYAEAEVLKTVKRRFDYAFAENPYPGAPQFQLHTIQPGQVHIEGVEFEALRVYHGRLPILGFRIGHFAYLTDLNRIEPDSVERLQNLEVLVLDALHHRPHHSHFNLHEALIEVERLQPEKAYFTHISHHMGLHDDINGQLPENVFLGYDGLNWQF